MEVKVDYIFAMALVIELSKMVWYILIMIWICSKHFLTLFASEVAGTIFFTYSTCPMPMEHELAGGQITQAHLYE